MNNKMSFSFETEDAIRKACDAITMKCKADLLIELWNRNLISDELFAKQMKYETLIPIDLHKKEL